MTATVANPATGTPAAPLAQRLLAVVRIQTANPWTTLRLPWLITAAIFGLTYAIWQIVIAAAGGVEHIAHDAFSTNGGVSSIFFYMLSMAIQAMNSTFRFALGLSVTRRDYFAGTAIYFAGLSVMYGTALALLAGVERATEGWGVGGAFFAPFQLGGVPLWQVAVLYIAMMLGFLGLGTAFAAVFVRWKTNGVLALCGLIVVAVVAISWLVIVTGGDGAVARGFDSLTALRLAAWALVPAMLGGALGYRLLRRATPAA